MERKIKLVTDKYYHIFNKSIAGYYIYNNELDYNRMIYLMKYYRLMDIPCRFTNFLQLGYVINRGLNKGMQSIETYSKQWVQIVAYCLMPTHCHLILKQLRDNGISTFMRLTLNSYAKYFNQKYHRKGPLWTGRFKNILIKSDEYLWHLTRYIHLNPTTSNLVKKPEFWQYSSYREYLNISTPYQRLCQWNDILDVTPHSYKTFVEDNIDYQKKLSQIKHLIIE